MQRIDASDPRWPLGLAQLERPPSALDLKGDWPRELPTLAIVGTRHPTPEALDWTRRVAADLARSGVLILSGGAYGIDRAAHEGALDAAGITVAILGTPIEPPYPRDHAPLYARIAERGGIVSETERGGWVGKGSFLQRNRLIAAAADAVLVVQAPYKSGALSTAAHARALSRPLLSCPWSPFEEAAQGGLKLLAEGHAKLVRDARDLAAALDITLVPEPRPEQLALALDATTQRVLTALTRAPQPPDALALALNMPMSVLQPALLELVLSGDAEALGSGYRKR